MYFPAASDLDQTDTALVTAIKNILASVLPEDLMVSLITSRLENDANGQAVDSITVFYRRGCEQLPISKLLNRLSELGDVTCDYSGWATGLPSRGITFYVFAPDRQAAAVGWLVD
jgi:hypothetical protein